MIEAIVAAVAVTTLVLVIAVVGMDVYIRSLVRQAMKARCAECDDRACSARLTEKEFKKSKMSILS